MDSPSKAYSKRNVVCVCVNMVKSEWDNIFHVKLTMPNTRMHAAIVQLDPKCGKLCSVAALAFGKCELSRLNSTIIYIDHMPWKRRIHFPQIGAITADIHTLTPKGSESADWDTHGASGFCVGRFDESNFAKHKGALKSIKLPPCHATHTQRQHKGAHFNHCFSWSFSVVSNWYFMSRHLSSKGFSKNECAKQKPCMHTMKTDLRCQTDSNQFH